MGGTVLSLQALWFLVSAPKAMLAARRAATHFCGSREGGLRCGRVRQAAAIPSGNAVAANMAARASDADRRGRCLSCPSPERLSCERQALCECFEYLSRINRVFGSTLLETERSSITTSAERPMRAAILRAPPGAGKASSHATTRADPCRELPAPDVDNLSLTLITSRDQSEQKPETRTQNAHAAFCCSHSKKIECNVVIGRNELIRTKREIEAGVPENRSQKKQSAPQKPTDPWVFGYGKPPWETAAETLWETEVWCLLCARMRVAGRGVDREILVVHTGQIGRFPTH